jgi:hypothetical protein
MVRAQTQHLHVRTLGYEYQSQVERHNQYIFELSPRTGTNFSSKAVCMWVTTTQVNILCQELFHICSCGSGTGAVAKAEPRF